MIPILPVTKPDIRTVLGQGASFLVNGAEVPWDYTDPITKKLYPQGMTVAFKRAILNQDMTDPTADRIRVLFNELLTMYHPPLRSHPNIVKLHGIAFETEGPADGMTVMPVLVPECAELGNLAEVLETARKEDRALAFDDKISLCIDIAHGLEILHACDIVHGDVKCENVLIFENDNELDNGDSKGKQAPELSRGNYLKLEAAKRTDIYSFGMLIWRVVFDGDPFQHLGKFEGKTDRERRSKRNEAIASLKQNDRLVQHVCESLAISDKFSRAHLEMLSEVMNITLIEDPACRELDLSRIIRLLTVNNWYESRHTLPPARLPMVVDTQLLDLEKWYSEFEKASPVTQFYIASGYRDSAQGLSRKRDDDENRSAAAYQLAICYANGFGVPFVPNECLRWLRIAAETSRKAQEVLPKVAEAFDLGSEEYVDIWKTDVDTPSDAGISVASISFAEVDYLSPNDRNKVAEQRPIASSWTLLSAAESCRYDIMESLLSASSKISISEDGVSPIHFLSSWDINRAEGLGRKLLLAGADINARAIRGPSVGGTPLMWSVYGDHTEHTRILIKLGANPMASMEDGADALSFASRLHLTKHLRLLLESCRPSEVRGHIQRLIEEVAGAESRFTRILRHGKHWKSAAWETLSLLEKWNSLFPDAGDFKTLLLPALHNSLESRYGRMNSDLKLEFIKKLAIEQSLLTDLLRQSVVSFNTELFNGLLDYGVPIQESYGPKNESLLHLCAKIPDHNLAATVFASRLLDLGAQVNGKNTDDVTPWMDAILERKWDLADLLMERGADPLAADREGFNVLGLCIKTINLGAIKYLLKYCKARSSFLNDAFVVNGIKQISALQLAASLQLPRAHGMKLEVMGTFLLILANFAKEPWQLNFRSDGILTHATALEIAASQGSMHPVKNLVKNGAHLESGSQAVKRAKASLAQTTDPLRRKNLERCIFIIEHWDNEAMQTHRLADDWTNMRTIDESHVASSWEIVVFDYKSRKPMEKASKGKIVPLE
ncbi:MAG: hypothetical protein Q9167_002192 [Letrouitia subvulpina]